MCEVALVTVSAYHVIKYEQALEAFRGFFHLGQCLFVRKVWRQNLLVDLFHQRTQQLAHVRLLTHARPQDFLKSFPNLVLIHNFDSHGRFA